MQDLQRIRRRRSKSDTCGIQSGPNDLVGSYKRVGAKIEEVWVERVVSLSLSGCLEETVFRKES